MEEKEFDYINVIPLVDVMLVLLTIVLTTSTFIASGMISVSLPKASEVKAEMLEKQIIAIDQGGAIYFNSMKVDLEGLGMKIRDIDKNTPLIVRADRDITLQIFVDVLDLVNRQGFKKVAIQTEKRG
ncbi:MAG TPA: biopolymer transporter ExbD [Syntrophales bacterium]|nr:biopolymer transporter ExbD [Syntrophales bacterium]